MEVVFASMMGNHFLPIPKPRDWLTIVYGVLCRTDPEIFGLAHLELELAGMMANYLRIIHRHKDLLLMSFKAFYRTGQALFGLELLVEAYPGAKEKV